MAEGTKFTQLSEQVTLLKGDTTGLKDSQARQERDTAAIREIQHQQQQETTEIRESQHRTQQLIEALTQQIGQLTEEGEHNIRRRHDNPLFDNQGAIQGRTIRLEFPRFDGSEESEWILRAQQFFDYYLTPEHQRVQLASFHMEGKALTWYQWLRDSEALGTWAEFIDALKVRFTLSAL
jgi:hypothetical protein